jgi:hypothetical protein
MPVYNYATLDDPLAQVLGTQAVGINDAGQIVGTYRTGFTFHSFLLSGGTYITIDDPSADQTVGTNVHPRETDCGSFGSAEPVYSRRRPCRHRCSGTVDDRTPRGRGGRHARSE